MQVSFFSADARKKWVYGRDPTWACSRPVDVTLEFCPNARHPSKPLIRLILARASPLLHLLLSSCPLSLEFDVELLLVFH